MCVAFFYEDFLEQMCPEKVLYALAIFLLVLGGFNLGMMGLTGTDPISTLFGKRSLITNALFVAVFVAALGLAFFRDSYLPFLGGSVVPCEVLQVHTPEGADREVRVMVKPGAKVLYWASEPANKDLHTTQDWRHAYMGFKNAGVALADDNGMAILRVRTPQPYTVPLKGMISSHVHYRVCHGGARLGPVETVSTTQEGFQNSVSREETNAPIETAVPFDYVQPSTALSEINNTARRTAAQSLMAESGAPEERSQAGSDLSAAFAPLI
jgi:uncharacterized membrane protein YuzA (DUF378 family)